jgi:hypothetical protein
LQEVLNQNGGSSDILNVDAIDRWEGELLRCRENIALAVMSAVSLAVLFVFVLSEMAMRAAPPQLGSNEPRFRADGPATRFDPGSIEARTPTGAKDCVLPGAIFGLPKSIVLDDQP